MIRSAILITGRPGDYVEFQDTRTVLFAADGFPIGIWWSERNRLMYPHLATPPQLGYRDFYARMDGHDGGDEQP
jgi:hypothetical protein